MQEKQKGPTDAQLSKMFVGQEQTLDTGGGYIMVKITKISNIVRGKEMVATGAGGIPEGEAIFPIRLTVHFAPLGDDKNIPPPMKEAVDKTPVISGYYYQDQFGEWKGKPIEDN